MRTNVKYQNVECSICNKTGYKSKCCGGNVFKRMFRWICSGCEIKCATVDCLICKGKGYVKMLKT